MNERHIVHLFLLPPHQQPPIAISPTVHPLDDPPLRLVPALAALLPRLPVALRDVRRITPPLERAPHGRVIVAFVSRQVLLVARARRRTLDRDAPKRRRHRPRVVAVRSRHLEA